MAGKQLTKTQTSRKRPPRSKFAGGSTLSSIARGMQYAVNSTQEIMEDHYARIFNKYFDQDGNPITVKFNLSSEQVVQAPLIALVPLNALVLEEMIVEMSIEVTETEQKKIETRALDIDVERSSFHVSFASGKKAGGETDNVAKQNGNTIGIVMKFKRGDPPEGVARVLDEFYKAVVMTRTEKEEK